MVVYSSVDRRCSKCSEKSMERMEVVGENPSGRM